MFDQSIMEDVNTIVEFKEQLKRIPESMTTHNQFHQLETKRAKKKTKYKIQR